MILVSLDPIRAADVARRMRDRDFVEFSAVTGIADREALAAWMSGRYGWIEGGLCGATDAGVPVCIGAGVQIRPGTASLLFYATDDFPEIALPVTRFIRRRFFPALEAAGFHRIECVTLGAYAEMHRWLEVLGMRREARLRAFGAWREDFLMYAWIADDARASRH